MVKIGFVWPLPFTWTLASISATKSIYTIIHLTIQINFEQSKMHIDESDTSGSHFTEQANPIFQKGRAEEKRFRVPLTNDEHLAVKHVHKQPHTCLRQKNQATNVTRITFVSTLSHIGTYTHTHTKFTIHKAKWHWTKMEWRTRENYDDWKLPTTRFQLYITIGWVGECACVCALGQSFIILFARFRHFGKR